MVPLSGVRLLASDLTDVAGDGRFRDPLPASTVTLQPVEFEALAQDTPTQVLVQTALPAVAGTYSGTLLVYWRDPQPGQLAVPLTVVARTRPALAFQGVERITVNATRCHPYLVQLVCSEVVGLANAQRTLLATPALVRDALASALERGEPYFRNLWDEATGADAETVAAGRHILREVADAASPLPVLTDVPATARALERLLRYDVLERVTGGVQFQVPLVQRWVRERAPVA